MCKVEDMAALNVDYSAWIITVSGSLTVILSLFSIQIIKSMEANAKS